MATSLTGNVRDEVQIRLGLTHRLLQLGQQFRAGAGSDLTEVTMARLVSARLRMASV